MFNTAKKEVQGVGLATITHTKTEHGDVLDVEMAGRAFQILNLETLNKTNGKEYQRGNLVASDVSYGTVTVEMSKNGNPYFNMYVKCPQLKAIIGHEHISGTMQDGKAVLWEQRDDKPQPQGNGQQQQPQTENPDPFASTRYEQQSNGG